VIPDHELFRIASSSSQRRKGGALGFSPNHDLLRIQSSRILIHIEGPGSHRIEIGDEIRDGQIRWDNRHRNATMPFVPKRDDWGVKESGPSPFTNTGRECCV